MSIPGFELRFDSNPSNRYPHGYCGYPHGYWYAITSDGNWDADGATPENALANLVFVLHKELIERTTNE